MRYQGISLAFVLAATALLQACATPAADDQLDARALARSTPNSYNTFIAGIEQRAKDAQLKATETQSKADKDRAEANERYKVFGGTGQTVKASADSNQATGATTASLSFEATDIRDVVKTVLFDILGENYYIDPQVGGNVTFRTVKPIPRNSLVPILEMLLRGVNSALVKEAGIYKVIPAAQAVRGTITPQLIGGTATVPPGYSVVVMPLKFIGIKEMLRILEPFAKDAASIRGDELRNLVILTGTERELRHLLETIEMFDIDWMAGMSVGFFQLQSVDVKNVVKELEAVFGNKDMGPLAGLYRVVPIERLNALLVISPQKAAIDKAREWIERLDSGGNADGQRLFVFHLQNARADKLAPILQQALTGRQQPQTTTPQVAPGQTPVQIGTAGLQPSQPNQPAPATTQYVRPVQPAVAAAVTAAGSSAGAELAVSRNVQIIADKDNNAIVILATQAEYSLIEGAIKKLDLAPRQVLIEAKIARVTLTGSFKLGLNWAFQNGLRIGTGNILSINPAASNTATNPFGISDVTKFAAGSGFNYAWSNFLNGRRHHQRDFQLACHRLPHARRFDPVADRDRQPEIANPGRTEHSDRDRLHRYAGRSVTSGIVTFESVRGHRRAALGNPAGQCRRADIAGHVRGIEQRRGFIAGCRHARVQQDFRAKHHHRAQRADDPPGRPDRGNRGEKQHRAAVHFPDSRAGRAIRGTKAR